MWGRRKPTPVADPCWSDPEHRVCFLCRWPRAVAELTPAQLQEYLAEERASAQAQRAAAALPATPRTTRTVTW